MKKVTNLVLIGSFIFGISSCFNGENETSSIIESSMGNESSMEEKDVIKLENQEIRIEFNEENGSITSLINKKTNRDFIKDSVGGNWAMVVDTSTSNPFEANHLSSNSVLISSRGFTPQISLRDNEIILNYYVSFTQNQSDYNGITVREIVNLDSNKGEITLNYQVSNNSNKEMVIVNFTSGIISGIKDDTNQFNLFWPNKEGKIYENALSLFKSASGLTRLVEQYPSPMSMQLIQLYDEKESLYYIVEDTTAEYKEFNFGALNVNKQYDYREVSPRDKISMSVTQYPFIVQNETKSLFPVRIGIKNNSSWYGAADEYRDFLISSEMIKDYTPMVKNWTGFIGDTISGYGDSIRKTYDAFNGSDTVLTQVDEVGIDSVVLFGWHQGGFDSMYPDYKFFEGEGFGEDGFKALVEKIHANNDYVIPYLNGHIADVKSEWSSLIADMSTNKTNMLAAAIKTRGFNSNLDLSKYENYMLLETYGTTTTYYAMCPKSKIFQEALNKAVERLAKHKIDGLWIDQVMEMPSYLCFDESHGHKTPATAYGEGYPEMLGKFQQTFLNEGIDDYLIFVEGANDAYLKYVDIPAYMWARKLGAPDNVHPGDGVNMAPQITKYTIPVKFLGIDGVDTTNGSVDQLSRAFIFGSPFKYQFGMHPIVKDMIRIYESNKSIFMNGRYMDKNGLILSNDEIIASIIISNDKNSLAVSFYNPTSTSINNLKVNVDLEQLGLNKQISSITNLFTNDKVGFNNDGFTLNLDTKETVSFKLNLN